MTIVAPEHKRRRICTFFKINSCRKLPRKKQEEYSEREREREKLTVAFSCKFLSFSHLPHTAAMDIESLRQKYNIPEDTSTTAITEALRKALERSLRPGYEIPEHVSMADAFRFHERIIGTKQTTNMIASALETVKGKGIAVAEEETEAENEIMSPAALQRRKLSVMPILVHSKLCIVGDRGTGKTTFLTRHLGGVSRKVCANGDEYVYPIDFGTNHGRICFDAFDSVRDPYLINGQCAIIMFDVHSISSRSSVSSWYRLIRKMCGDIPIVVCANKRDIVSRTAIRSMTFPRSFKYVMGVDMSAIAYENFELPFIYLAWMLTSCYFDDLKILRDSYTLPVPPEVPTPDFDYRFRWTSR